LIKLIEDHYDNLNNEQSGPEKKNIKVACVKLELPQSEEIRLLKLKAQKLAQKPAEAEILKLKIDGLIKDKESNITYEKPISAFVTF
jgi:hypothetical protein